MTQHPARGYPVLLDLQERTCVVVGGGAVAARKIVGLLDAGARITVISPKCSPDLTALAATGQINIVPEPYAREHLAALRPLLVFAATDSPAVNRQVADDARALGVLVDVVDASAPRDFSSMAFFRRGLLTIALSTGGASPALLKHLRARLEAAVGEEYTTLLEWLAELRPRVQEQIKSQPNRRAFWDAVLASDALDLLRQGDETAARRTVMQLLSELAQGDEP